MARVVGMLRRARAAGFDIRRDGDALIVRGPEDLGDMARDLLAIKPLVLAALQREEEYRRHELTTHEGAPADWQQGPGGRLVCATCQPLLIPGMDTEPPAVWAVMAAADTAAATTERQPPLRACPTFGASTGSNGPQTMVEKVQGTAASTDSRPSTAAPVSTGGVERPLNSSGRGTSERDLARPDYPKGVLCQRDGCRALGWTWDASQGAWRCVGCGGPLPGIEVGWV